jgi:drug/metabolite transporter (DMT)-like permease
LHEHQKSSVPATTSVRLGAPEWGLIALQSMLWGSAFFWIAFARQDLPPITITALRLIPAVAILLLVLAWKRLRLPADLRTWGHLIGFAAFNNVIPFILIIYAQREVTTGMSAVFNATAPLFTLLLAQYLLVGEAMSWRKVIGIITGVSGVGLIAGPALTGASNVSASSYVMLLAAPLCYAIATIYARHFLIHIQPFVLATAQMIASLVFAAPLALAVEHPWTLAMPRPSAIGAILAMGIFGSALASLCHFTVLRRAGATNAMLVTLLLPVTPLILGSAFLGEIMSDRDMIGAAVIALALLIIDGRLLKPFFNSR